MVFKQVRRIKDWRRVYKGIKDTAGAEKEKQEELGGGDRTKGGAGPSTRAVGQQRVCDNNEGGRVGYEGEGVSCSGGQISAEIRRA